MHKSQFLASGMCGAEQVDNKCVKPFICYTPTLYPNQNTVVNDDNMMLVTSNKSMIQEVCVHSMHQGMSNIPRTHTVVDTGATSVFVMKGTPMLNVCLEIQPLTINFPDGKTVKSTHICYVMIPGLPTLPKGHIVPDLGVASLLGICILCKAGCIVGFTNIACHVMYNQKIILTGAKDISIDLWTLPISPDAITSSTSQEGQWTTPGMSLPQASPCIAHAPRLPLAQNIANTQAMLPIELASFTHSVCT
jgi:hypothetical protein